MDAARIDEQVECLRRLGRELRRLPELGPQIIADNGDRLCNLIEQERARMLHAWTVHGIDAEALCAVEGRAWDAMGAGLA